MFISSLKWGYKSLHQISWCWHCGRWKIERVQCMRGAGESAQTTYLSCGAEWLPGRRSGKQRWVEPTTASCWLSSHTDLLTLLNAHKWASQPWMKILPTVKLWHFTCTTFICRINPSFTVFIPPSLPLSLFSLCVCSALRPGCLGSHLEIIRILGSACPLGWTWLTLSDTGWQREWPTDWYTEWLSNWLDN